MVGLLRGRRGNYEGLPGSVVPPLKRTIGCPVKELKPHPTPQPDILKCCLGETLQPPLPSWRLFLPPVPLVVDGEFGDGWYYEWL